MGFFKSIKKAFKGAGKVVKTAAKVANVAKVIKAPTALGVAGLAAGALYDKMSDKKGPSKKSDDGVAKPRRSRGQAMAEKRAERKAKQVAAKAAAVPTPKKEAPKVETKAAKPPHVGRAGRTMEDVTKARKEAKKTYGSAIKYTPKGVKVATRQDRKIGEGETIQHREWHVYKDVDTGKQMKTRNQAEAQANAAKKKTEPTPVPAMKCGGKVHKYSHGGGVQVRGKTKGRYI